MSESTKVFGGMGYAPLEYASAPPSEKYDNRSAVLSSLSGVATMENAREKPRNTEADPTANPIAERYRSNYITITKG